MSSLPPCAAIFLIFFSILPGYLICASPLSPDDNEAGLLKNPGFEESGSNASEPLNWAAFKLSPDLSTGEMRGCRDTGEHHSGNACYKITGAKKNGHGHSASKYISFSAPYPTRILLKGYVKGTISGATQLYAWVDTPQKNAKSVSGRAINKAVEWQEETLLIEETAVKGLRVLAIASGEGCVYWDDFSVTVLPNVKKTAIRCSDTSAPPKLDGKLDDPCWQDCARLMPFRLVGSGESAREQTVGYTTHDDQCLYLAVECFESCLNPVNNLLQEFKAREKARDGEVFKDDCVEIFLDPRPNHPEIKDYLHLAVNPLGTIYDALGSADKSWNGGIKTGVSVNEKSWIVEVAVPFASLGIKNPAKGETWGFNLCREEKQANENSSWAKIGWNFHQPENFGLMVFGKNNPLTVRKTSLLENGVSAAIKNKSPEKCPSAMLMEIIPPDGRRKLESRVMNLDPDKETVCDMDYPALADGINRIITSWHDPKSGEIHYAVETAVQSRNCQATVKTFVRGASTLYLNGSKQDGPQAKWKLQPGLNVMAIRCQGHDQNPAFMACMEIESTGQTIVSDTGWLAADETNIPSSPKKTATRKTPSWKDAEYDDSNWPNAGIQEIEDVRRWQRESGCMPGARPIWSAQPRQNSAVCFRRSILVHDTVHFADRQGGGVIALNSGNAQLFYLEPEKKDKASLKNYDWILELPEGMDLQTVEQTTYTVKNIERNGVARKQFIFPDFDRQFVKYPHANLQAVILTSNDPSKNVSIYYFAQSKKGNVTENLKELRVEMLPPLKGKRPQKTILGLYYSFSKDVPYFPDFNPENARKLAQTAKNAGFNMAWINDEPWTYYWNNLPDEQRIKEGDSIKKIFHEESFKIWGLSQGYRYLVKPADHKSHAEWVEMDKAGKAVICKSTLAEKGCPECEAALAGRLKSIPHHALIWDLEEDPFKSPNSCYCSKCMADFRAFAKIKNQPSLSPKIISEQYQDAWIDFQCRLNVKLAGRLRNVTRQFDKNILFGVYSDYENDQTKRVYGVDWKQMGPFCDLISCGYGMSPDPVTKTQNITKKPLVPGILSFNCGKKCGATTFIALLRLLIDSRGAGLFFWTSDGLDARDFQNAAKVSRLVADYERFFINFDPAPLVCDRGQAMVLKHQNQRLILVFNKSPGEKTVALKSGDSLAGLILLDALKNQKIDGRFPLELPVPGNDAAVIFAGTDEDVRRQLQSAEK
ncbi:MAG: carbohydrate-binding family 9-like protein [Verrucomicrobiae bacterium]|nr:carbohydrate-binding family 9-like protein [Verrucomicrobiae bacterium]